MAERNKILSDISKIRKPLMTASACLGATAYFITQNTWIDVEQFEVGLQNFPGQQGYIRIVHISDAHLPKSRKGIDKLAKLVREQKPDMIVATGDLIDCTSNIETCGLAKLCQRLREVAPVYAVTGNHEFKSRQVEIWREILERNGIIIVDDDYDIFEKNGLQIAVMGLSNAMPYDSGVFEDVEKIKDIPKILLAHHPEKFGSYASSEEEVIPDLIFCGHAHGGQVRLPLVGGLFAPDQGVLPKFTSGMYEAENSIKMIVSRGIGNSEFPLRVGNRPHLPVVTITGENADE